MATHYSIFYASIRKVTHEKVSLGLLLFDNETVYFKFSTKKLAGLKAFLPKADFQLIHQSINAVHKKIQSFAVEKHFSSSDLMKITHSAFTIDYINYLSRYKNNLVIYSEPKAITLEATESNVLKLYESLVESEDPESNQFLKVTRRSPIEQLSLRFEGKIDQYFNTNYLVTSDRIPNLLVPVKVDLLGKNGSDVLVRTIDTSNGPEKISNEISTFYVLKDAYKKNRIPVMDFIVAEEPLHKFKKQYDIWKHLKESGDFTYLDLSDADKLREYAEKNHVKPIKVPLETDIDEIPF